MNYILKNPKLTLFAFHLRNELAKDNEPDASANLIWEWCENLSKDLNIKELQGFKDKITKQGKIGLPPTQDYPDSDYLELLEEESLVNFSIPDTQPQVNGAVYPLQIHDAYALDITLHYQSNTANAADFRILNPANFLLPKYTKESLKDNFLGQTLLLCVESVGVKESQDYQLLAKTCISGLIPNIEVKENLTAGILLGSPIFEYDNGQEKPGKNLHILIWFKSESTTKELPEADKYYPLLVMILCCRNKILFAYSESRKSSEKVKNLYKELKNAVDNLHGINQLPSETDKRLKKLKQMLISLSNQAFDYNRHLRDLEIQYATIKTNCKNYKIFQKKLEDINVKDRDDLQFLQSFLSHARNKLAGQIQVDLSYLNTGRELYGELIDSIRGIAEIEQAEIDRSLERNVQIFGVALAGGAIVSGVVTQHTKDAIKPPVFKDSSNPITISLTWSFIATIGFGSFALIWWVLWQRLVVPLWRKVKKQ